MCDALHTSLDPKDESLLSFHRNIHWCALWDYRGAELLNSALTFTFGLWLLIPQWDAFHQCPQAYLVMEALGQLIWPNDPELPWGIAFMLTAIAKGLVLWRDHTRGRKWTALISGALWTYVAVTIAFSNYRGPMFPLYILFALNMYRVFFCIRVPKAGDAI